MRDNRTGQFGWVVLLLATAVILPTVCLLWFMTKAVQNERLAVRQKLVDVYQEKVARVTSSSPDLLANLWRETQDVNELTHKGLKGFWREAAHLDGYVLFGPDGRMGYPRVDESLPVVPAAGTRLAKAWALEFSDANSVAAAQVYGECAKETSDPAEICAARTAQARCLLKAGLSEEAKKVLAEIGSYPYTFTDNSRTAADYMVRARVMLARLCVDTGNAELESNLRKLAQFDRPCHSETWIWAMEQFIAMSQQAGLEQKMGTMIVQAEREITTTKTSVAAAAKFPSPPALADWPVATVRRLADMDALYGVHFDIGQGHVLCIVRPQQLELAAFAKGIEDTVVSCRILDDDGRLVFGDPNATSQPFLKAGLGKWMPDWKLELYLRDASAFEKAAGRQAAIYAWVAVLVISLIGAAAVAAGLGINRQMKINRLKNDFVATVTHELKTPLASMRILVDTLLEGNCKDRVQEREYLELVAKENLRLSRLIDNFLTFSRMERNKKAFDIQPCRPDKIVADAMEAVKTKFESRKCQFTAEVSSGMPDARADHDSIVTVLVNLLDNACKYSGDDKQIDLRAFVENGEVCFSVTDNGYGMTRKVMKKIFDRFYQADQSLARSAEGCGLGLAIVKFIVDAHRGRIDVQSRPGEGSCFTVRLPAM